MTAHSTRSHSKLSPSASHRWTECPGSIRMCRGLPDSSSIFADEGTAAHELAAHCFHTGFDADRFVGEYVNIDGTKPFEKFVGLINSPRCFEVTDEMAEGVQEYLDFCREIANGKEVESETEQWLSLEYLGIEGLDGGTGDFVAYEPNGQTLNVVDFKYGRGVAVEPEQNKQGLQYALGAIRRYHNRGLKKVRITIAQPRCPHPKGSVRTWEADVVNLLDFEVDLMAAARATHEPDAPLIPGEHCRFCPAKAICPARRDQALAIAQAEFSAVGEMELPLVIGMTPEELGKLLPQIGQLEDFVRGVKEFAHQEAVHGRCPIGHKLVAKRATRKWRDEGTALTELTLVYGLEDVMTEPKLKSPAQIESLMPGDNKAARAKALASLVTKESSGTVLAPETDPRPAVRADALEFATEE